jgi:hypothetical protein
LRSQGRQAHPLSAVIETGMPAWTGKDFKIAINMAGAVSAGAYTAGVLDFLIEALEEWEKAKLAFRSRLANPVPDAPFPTPVPLHDITIEAFSGASAGGMCAAIASVMVQRPFQHITNGAENNTNNTFYESWVNKIDISKLLTTEDIKGGKPLVSLLDSTIIDQIAVYALTPTGTASTPSYISKALTLFLTLTNVRGVPYRLYADPSPGSDEFISYYADRIRFEVTQPGQITSTPLAKPLPLDQPQAPGWTLLREAGKATGAFPIFLAPRELARDLADYHVPNWVPICGPNPTPPIVSDLPSPPPEEIQTLNVDGGVTDNDPFDLAHDYLAGQNRKATIDPVATGTLTPANPRSPLEANCAVISIAPFPSLERYDPNFDPAKARGLFQMLARLVSVLISQSRFLGESLVVAAAGPSFSRFFIAPSEHGSGKVKGSALQCGSLGAFGGFMERSFRVHDFLLGRRNCQKFLESHLLLPVANPIIAAGQQCAGSYAAAIESRFGCSAPPGVTTAANAVWIPLIPRMGSALNKIPRPARGTISRSEITKIADAVLKRLKAIRGQLLPGGSAGCLLKLGVGLLCSWPARLLIRGRIVDALTNALSGQVAD